MPRRKPHKSLTGHQHARIQAIRTRRVERWHTRQQQTVEQLEHVALGTEQAGLVTAHFGLNVAVEDATGHTLRCAVRETVAENPVVGDRVLFRPASAEQGVIEALMPRTSLLQRPTATGPQNLAANVDRLMITTTLVFKPELMDRYLVAAEAAQLGAVIVVNKMDLADNDHRAQLERTLAPYRAMSYPTVLVSARTRTGLDQLDALFQDHTSVFVGLSGVGKSSLIAHWCPEETIPVANVNPNTGQGRHTTTVARLYHLPRGGDLIDSPGVRTFGLYQMDPQEVPYHFRDLAPHVGHCRFANCRHEQEPGCALVQAVATGAAYPERLESLRNLMRSSRRAYEGRYDATVTGG